MAYNIKLEDLLTLVDHLKSIYKKTNPQRLSFLAALEEAVRSTEEFDEYRATNILFGAVVMELEYIRSKYRVLDPTRSSVFAEILKKLNLELKDLNYQENIFYVTKFKKFVDLHWKDENIERLKKNMEALNRARNSNVSVKWTTKDAFIKSIDKVLASMADHYSADLINLRNASPELIGLRRNLREVPQKYYDAVKQQSNISQFMKKDPLRKKYLALLKLIEESCARMYQTQERNEILEKSEISAISGMFLCLIFYIRREYKFFEPRGSWVVPGSKMYELSLNALNRKYFEDIENEKKVEWLSGLSTHLNTMRDGSQRAFYESKKKEWQDQGLGDLDELLGEVNALIQEKLPQRTENRGVGEKVAQATTSTAIYYGAREAMTAVANSGVIEAGITAISGTVGAALGGPVGGIALGGGGMIVGKVIAMGFCAFIKSDIVSNAVGGLGAWLLDQVSQTAAGKVLAILGKYNKKGNLKDLYDALRRNLTPQQEITFCRFVNSLMAMPNNIITESDKNQLRQIFVFNSKGKLETYYPAELQILKAKKTESRKRRATWYQSDVSVIVEYAPTQSNARRLP